MAREAASSAVIGRAANLSSAGNLPCSGHLGPRGAAGGIERDNNQRPGWPPGLLGMRRVGKKTKGARRRPPEWRSALELECAGRCEAGVPWPLCPGNPLVIPSG